jgi:hypothetical protein
MRPVSTEREPPMLINVLQLIAYLVVLGIISVVPLAIWFVAVAASTRRSS